MFMICLCDNETYDSYTHRLGYVETEDEAKEVCKEAQAAFVSWQEWKARSDAKRTMLEEEYSRKYSRKDPELDHMFEYVEKELEKIIRPLTKWEKVIDKVFSSTNMKFSAYYKKIEDLDSAIMNLLIR